MKVYKDENNIYRFDEEEDGDAIIVDYFIDDKRGYWYYVVEQNNDIFVFLREDNAWEEGFKRGVRISLTPDQIKYKIENIVYDYLNAFFE